MIGNLDEFIKPSVLTLPKMSGNVKNFNDANNKLMSLRIDNQSYKKSMKPVGLRLKT